MICKLTCVLKVLLKQNNECTSCDSSSSDIIIKMISETFMSSVHTELMVFSIQHKSWRKT